MTDKIKEMISQHEIVDVSDDLHVIDGKVLYRLWSIVKCNMRVRIKIYEQAKENVE